MNPSFRRLRADLGQGLQGLAIVALLALVVFAQFTEPTRFMHVLQKLAHPVTFGAIALLILTLPRRSTPAAAREYVVAFALAVLGGAATEFAQGFVGRDPSLLDVLRDAGGAATALVAFALLAPGGVLRQRGPCRAVGATAALGALALMLAPLAFSVLAYARRDLAYPTLAQWCSPFDRYFLRPVGAQLSGVSAPRPLAAPCGTALRVALRPEIYPGLHLIEPYPDWRRARALVVDLHNPGELDLPLALRVHDRAHNQQYRDRFNREFTLHAGEWLELAIPVREIEAAPAGRSMDLSKVAGVMIFRVRGTDAASFEIEKIALRL